MALTLNPKELEDLKPYVDKVVQRFVGLSEPAVVNAAMSLLGAGADKHQLRNKLQSLHPSLNESQMAHKLTDRIFEIASEYMHSAQQHHQKAAKKRTRDDGQESKAPKVTKTEEEDNGPTPSPGQLTALQIKEMMANAQRMIEERKRALEAMGGISLPPAVVVPPVRIQPPAPTAPLFDDKKRKLAELQAQIQSKLAANAITTRIRDEEEGDLAKPIPLLLDNEGRAIDVSGKQLLFPTRQPTLKANIRAQKKAETKQFSKDKATTQEEEAEESNNFGNKYFDERLGDNATLKKERKKKSLKFNDPGKYVALAHKQRMQAQLSKLQQEIAEKARKTGISTAARLAKLSGAGGQSDKTAEYIPQVEWWDSLILEEDKDPFNKEPITYDSPIKKEAITNLIEHPTQLRCPTEPSEPIYMPVFLTKKERKKLRRQNRRETWKEKQEKIRLGLEPPPSAKVRISNLMRVLGVEAVQDPTKVEAHVRKEMAKRLKNHQEANLSRKLTPEQRKAKKMRKQDEDVSLGVNVSVYRIDCLANQSKRFKVDTVARQLHMTGVVIMYRECNMVVVEGGPRQQRNYRKLMQSRIKWDEDMVKDKEDQQNKCVLVWEGMVKERCFSDFKFKMMKSEDIVREYFKRHGTLHYWDAALSGSVLESILDTV